MTKTENVTDPYRLSVWATPSNDIPLKVKGGDEFPPNVKMSLSSNQVQTSSPARGQVDSQKYTKENMMEVYHCNCQEGRLENSTASPELDGKREA